MTNLRYLIRTLVVVLEKLNLDLGRNYFWNPCLTNSSKSLFLRVTAIPASALTLIVTERPLKLQEM